MTNVEVNDISREVGAMMDNIGAISLTKGITFDVEGTPGDTTLVCVVTPRIPPIPIDRTTLRQLVENPHQGRERQTFRGTLIRAAGMKRTDLTILQRFWLETLWLGARVFAVMPYWFKYYVVENLLFVLLYYCLRYRMKVVKTNLRNSFPEKSERELAVIRRRFYRTLAEIFVDTINLAGLNERKGAHGADGQRIRRNIGSGARPGLDRSDGSFRVLGVLLLLGALRAVADAGRRLPSAARAR